MSSGSAPVGTPVRGCRAGWAARGGGQRPSEGGVGLAAAASAWLAGSGGEPAAVERHAADAAMYLDGLDGLESRGLNAVACAEAATLVGESPAARRHRQAAIDLFTAKGNLVAVARQQALL